MIDLDQLPPDMNEHQCRKYIKAHHPGIMNASRRYIVTEIPRRLIRAWLVWGPACAFIFLLLIVWVDIKSGGQELSYLAEEVSGGEVAAMEQLFLGPLIGLYFMSSMFCTGLVMTITRWKTPFSRIIDDYSVNQVVKRAFGSTKGES